MRETPLYTPATRHSLSLGWSADSSLIEIILINGRTFRYSILPNLSSNGCCPPRNKVLGLCSKENVGRWLVLSCFENAGELDFVNGNALFLISGIDSLLIITAIMDHKPRKY